MTQRRSTHPSRQAGVEPAGTAALADVHSGDERPFSELRRTLHEALGVLIVRRWFFFIPFCLAASVIFIGSLRLPRTYTAGARFERRDDPVFMNLPKSEGTGSFSYFRQTLERDIVAPDYMAEVVEHLKLAGDLEHGPDGSLTPESRKKAEGVGRSLAGYVSTFSRERSPHLDLIEVVYTGPDPVLGKRLVDEVRNTYVRRTQLRIREFLEEQRDWYTTRLSEGTQRLWAAQKRYAELLIAHPYSHSGDPTSIAQSIEDLKREARELGLRKNGLAKELAAERQLLAEAESHHRFAAQAAAVEAPVILPLSAEARRLASRIQEISSEIQELRTTGGMTDQHPRVQDLKAERQRFERLLEAQVEADQPATGPITAAGEGGTAESDPLWPHQARMTVAIQTLESQLADLESAMTINRERLQRYQEAKDRLFEHHEEFASARQEVEMAVQEVSGYRSILDRIDPVLKANDMGRAVQFHDEQPPTGSNIAISPKSKTIVLAALFAGLCAGAVFTILAELVDHVYRSSAQVARSLGLHVLETIDVIVTSADRRRRLLQRVVAAPAVLAAGLSLVAASGAAAYLSIENPATYERLRSIPNSLIQRFTMAAPFDGARDVSDTAAAIADTIAAGSVAAEVQLSPTPQAG